MNFGQPLPVRVFENRVVKGMFRRLRVEFVLRDFVGDAGVVMLLYNVTFVVQLF